MLVGGLAATGSVFAAALTLLKSLASMFVHSNLTRNS
jgi:hypothetical protein